MLFHQLDKRTAWVSLDVHEWSTKSRGEKKKIKPSCDVNKARKSRPQSYFVRTNTDCTVCPIGFIYHMLCSRIALFRLLCAHFFLVHFVHFACVCSLCLFEFSVSIHRIRRNSFSLFTFDKYVLWLFFSRFRVFVCVCAREKKSKRPLTERR